MCTHTKFVVGLQRKKPGSLGVWTNCLI